MAAAATTCSSASSAARAAGSSSPAPRPREQETQSAGTGFVISRDGFILTNNHVVEGATKIEVAFFNEEADVYYEAKVVGRDPLTDSALIQLVDAKRDLTEVKFGDSAQMQPGDWVVAIGNPFGLGHTVSVGVISATRASACRWRNSAAPTCCRPTPPSIPGTRAARCSTRAAK